MFDDVRKRFQFFFIPFTQHIINLSPSGKIVPDTYPHAGIDMITKGLIDMFQSIVASIWTVGTNAHTAKFDVQINEYLKSNPYLSKKPEEGRLYYSLLSEKPTKENIEKLMALANDIDLYTVHEKIIYILVNTKYSDSKFSNNLIEKVLKVEATTRNHATMVKMGGGWWLMGEWI